VQYQRLMDVPSFDEFDLSTFAMKFCTSSHFSATLKAQVLARWPGGLVEFYGMTEGGGTCILNAHEQPAKLHTVGKPVQGHDIRLIDEAGTELIRWTDTGLQPSASLTTTKIEDIAGEVIGHSPGMMTGYHNQPEKTREAEWYATDGKRFIRTGDIGRFDRDGFLTLFDRRKDMIISGGFNIYPSDLESVLAQHPLVAESSVVAQASHAWGETPVAWVVLKSSAFLDADVTTIETNILNWCNEQVGKTQRLAGLAVIDALPRNGIGKVLKTELRKRWSRPVA
jgi:long-chain acyl-CoA synthetase